MLTQFSEQLKFSLFRAHKIRPLVSRGLNAFSQIRALMFPQDNAVDI